MEDDGRPSARIVGRVLGHEDAGSSSSSNYVITLSKSRDSTGGLLSKVPSKFCTAKWCRPEREGCIPGEQMKGDTSEDARVLARMGRLRGGAGLKERKMTLI